jgi:hypothetical protein
MEPSGRRRRPQTAVFVLHQAAALNEVSRASFTGERLTDDSGKLVLTRVSLHRSEGFGRRELCGADRREESGDGADEDGGGEAACPGAGGDDGGPVFG